MQADHLNPRGFGRRAACGGHGPEHWPHFWQAGPALRSLRGGPASSPAISTRRSSSESSVCIRRIVSAYCSPEMAISSGPGRVSVLCCASGSGTLKFSGACFLRSAARRASCWAWRMLAAAKGSKGRANCRGHTSRTARNRPISPSCTASSKSKPGAVAVGGSLADGRHHAGDERGKRIFIPLLCAGGQLRLDHRLCKGMVFLREDANNLIIAGNAPFVNLFFGGSAGKGGLSPLGEGWRFYR